MTEIPVKAIKDWIGVLSDDRIVFKTPPYTKDQYYSALERSMFMEAEEAIPMPPIKMMEYGDDQLHKYADDFYPGDFHRAIDELTEFRQQWTPNIVPLWDADHEQAKWDHLVALKRMFEFVKPKVTQFLIPRPDAHSPDWVDEIIAMYEEEEEEELEQFERNNQH